MYKPTTHRGLAVCAAALSVLAAATACGLTDPGADEEDSSLPTVRFSATELPSSIGTVAAVIEKHHLDEECGINLDVQSFSPDAAEIAVLSGQTDVGYFGYNSWAGSEEKLSKLSMLAPLQAEHGTLFVPEDSPAQSLEDLKGQKIAMLPPVSATYNDFKMLVANMGMDLEKDFKPVTGPPPAVEAFLKRGEVAAAILFEPNATNLEVAGGFRPLFKLNEQWTDANGSPLYMLGVTANKKWLAGHETEAACAAEAVNGAITMLAEDPSVYDELRADLGAKDDEHLSLLTENLSAIYTPETAADAEAAVKKQLQTAQDLGLIAEAPATVFTPLGE